MVCSFGNHTHTADSVYAFAYGFASACEEHAKEQFARDAQELERIRRAYFGG